MKPEQLQDETEHQLHHQFIDVLIKKEEQRLRFRQAIIEKTLASLLWSGIAGGGVFIVTLIKDHWR